MIGKKLNQRYEILAHIGEGATSTVYLGRDSLLGRDVAIKVLLPHVRESTRVRFFQEANAAAQLNHPNIMALYDMGKDSDRDYLVVEYIDGDSLASYVPSAPELVVALGSQIARALHYAHENDIIHRDIKPANIKVTPQGQIKIMDLGLALPREAKRVTAPGMVIGTPAYISPEQAQGHELDRRTDIYSLGIVLYEMLTGQLPFNADDITALLLQHVQQPPPPPRLIKPDITPSLEHVILKTLEKRKDRRFQSADLLAEALEATLPVGGFTTGRDAEIDQTSATRQTGRLNDPNARPRRMIKVVMADDHVLLRRALASYLEANEEFLVLAEASDGDQALLRTLELQPDVLLLDLNMPGKSGLDILPSIREQAPDVKVLVLTGRDDDIYIMRALRAGAHGYLLKSTDESKLMDAIRKVMDDEIVLGRGIAGKIVSGMLNDADNELTETERAVLLHVAAGYSDEQIGAKLNVPMTEMIEIMARIMTKLKVRDRTNAALRALRDGHISLDDLHELRPPQIG